MSKKIVEVNHLSFAYENDLILKNINLAIEEGGFISILGQSGSGKSTLLRLLAFLEKPTSGEVKFDGVALSEPSMDIGVVFQDYSLFPWMSIKENLMLALKQKDNSIADDILEKKISEYLNKVGLSSDIKDKYPNELSGGMKQRCAICRALLLDSRLLLMDEPFGALDAITRNKLQDLTLDIWLQSQQENKKTIIFVTHDIEEALYLSTKVFVLKSSPGEVIYELNLDKSSSMSREDFYSEEKLIMEKNKIMNLLNHDLEKKMKKESQYE